MKNEENVLMKIYFFILLITSFTSTASVGEPNVIWRKLPISVCFKDWHFEEHKPLLDEIKNVVTREFTKERTGISFTGWDKCDVDSVQSHDIIIAPNNALHMALNASGEAPIGDHSVNVPDLGYIHDFTADFENTLHLWDPVTIEAGVLKTSAKVQKLPVINFLSLVALHEFGHVAGLRHEHLHLDDALKDKNCSKELKAKFAIEKLGPSAQFYGGYDITSVMNYCWVNTIVKKGLRKKIYLSNGDIIALRQMYKN